MWFKKPQTTPIEITLKVIFLFYMVTILMSSLSHNFHNGFENA